MIRRKKVDTKLEEVLITGLITSNKFCQEFLGIVKPDWLKSPYAKVLFTWVKDYYETYKEAPGRNIQGVFLSKKDNLPEDKADMVAEYLEVLSDNWEQLTGFNENFEIDRCTGFVKKASIQNLTDNLNGLLQVGDLTRAQNLIADFRSVAAATSEWSDLLGEDFVRDSFSREEDILLTLPGAVGDLFGGLKRKWLVGIMAPMKRGKTWWLNEFLWAGLVSNLKVAFISGEMEKGQIAMRFYKSLTGLPEGDGPQNVLVPIMDCFRNQTGECRSSSRKGCGDLLNEEGQVRRYNSEIDHKVCTVCRDQNNKAFKPAVWYYEENRVPISFLNTNRKIKSFRRMYNYGGAYVLSYPIGTANVRDIEGALDRLEYEKDFIPDIVIIDYADILKKEFAAAQGRDAINDTWKAMKSLAQKRNILVVTATQGNRSSLDRSTIQATDTSEDIRKLAHVDAMGGLSQTVVEKRRGIMRFGLLMHRDKHFDSFTQTLVLQQPRIGAFHLDSCPYFNAGVN